MTFYRFFFILEIAVVDSLRGINGTFVSEITQESNFIEASKTFFLNFSPQQDRKQFQNRGRINRKYRFDLISQVFKLRLIL